MADQANNFVCSSTKHLLNVLSGQIKKGLSGYGPLTQFIVGNNYGKSMSDEVQWHTETGQVNDSRPVHVRNVCADGVGVAVQGDMVSAGKLGIPLTKFDDTINQCTNAPKSYRPMLKNGEMLAWEQLPPELQWQLLEVEQMQAYSHAFFSGIEYNVGQLLRHGGYEAEFSDGKPMVADFGRDERLTGDIVDKGLAAKYLDKAKWNEIQNSLTGLCQYVGEIGQSPALDIIFGPATFTKIINADAEITKWLNRNSVTVTDIFSELDLKPNLSVKKGMVYHGTSIDGSVRLWTCNAKHVEANGSKYHIEPGHACVLSREDTGIQAKLIDGPIKHPDLHIADGRYKAPGIWLPPTRKKDAFRRKMEFYARKLLVALRPNCMGYFQVLSPAAIKEVNTLLARGSEITKEAA